MGRSIEYSPLVHGFLHEFMENCRTVGCARQVGNLAVANGLCLRPFDFVRLVVVADTEDHEPDEHLVATFLKEKPETASIGTVTKVGSDGAITVLPETGSPGLSLEHTFLLAACLRAALPAKVTQEQAESLVSRVLSYVEAEG